MRTLLAVMLLCGWMSAFAAATETPLRADDGHRELHPVDAVFYLEYEGRQQHIEAIHNSAAYVAFHESGLEELAISVLDFVDARLDSQSDLAVARDLYRGVREAVRRGLEHGMSVSLAIPQEGLPIPRLTLVLNDSGELVEEWVGFASGLANEFPEMFEQADLVSEIVEGRDVCRITAKGEVNAEIATWQEGRHAVLTIGLGASRWGLAVVTAKMENLTSNETLMQGLAQEAEFEVILRSVVDFNLIMRKYAGFAIPNDSGQPLTVGEVFKISGLDRLGLMSCQSGYQDTAIWTQTSLVCRDLAEENKPMFGLSELPPLPWDATSVCATDLDAAGGFRALMKMLDAALEFAPKSERDDAYAVLDQLDEQLGFQIEEDLLAPLGDLACLYLDPDGGSYGIGFGIAIKLSDAERFIETMDKIYNRLTASNDTPMVLLQTEKLDRPFYMSEFYIDEGSVQFGALGIDENWVVIGLMPQTVTAFFHRLDGSIVPWEPTEELQACLDEMPPAYHQLSFSDARASTRLIYNWLVFVTPFIQAGFYNSGVLPDDATLPVHVEDLPPAELIIDPLFPTVSTCTSQGETLIWTTRSATGMFGLLGLY